MTTITDDQLDELGQIADQIDNLCGAMKLPLPAATHVQQLSRALPEVSKKIKALVAALGGYDPWDEHDD